MVGGDGVLRHRVGEGREERTLVFVVAAAGGRRSDVTGAGHRGKETRAKAVRWGKKEREKRGGTMGRRGDNAACVGGVMMMEVKEKGREKEEWEEAAER